MNYFVPHQGVPAQVPAANFQGVPGLVQMHQMMQPGQVQLAAAGGLTPQVMGAASHPQLHMVPQQLQHHIQPGLMSAPRVVPMQQAQLQQLIAVSQYQQQQAQQAQYQQAIRQQSYHRAITSVASSAVTRPAVLTPKTPPISSFLKPDTVDAEVQTPECDQSPEADSSTKARIITPTLLCCSNIVSSEYRQLQCRILTWGEQGERQALEVTRVKADISPSGSMPMPTTTASVIMMDDRKLQFNVCGKVIKDCVIPEKEDSQLDEQNVREYLDLLADSFSFCHGLSDTDLENVGPLAIVKCNNLIQRQLPVSGAFAVNCDRWCKIPDDEKENIQCDACKKAYEIVKSTEVNSVQVSGKRPAALCHDDLPTQPRAKRPRLLEVDTAKMQLDVVCEHMVQFQNAEKDDESVKKFLETLGNDLQEIRSLYQEVEAEDLNNEEIREEKEVTEDVKEDIESELINTSPMKESEDIDEEALLNGTDNGTDNVLNGEEEDHVLGDSQDVSKTAGDSTESGEGKQQQQQLSSDEKVSVLEVNGDGEK